MPAFSKRSSLSTPSSLSLQPKTDSATLLSPLLLPSHPAFEYNIVDAIADVSTPYATGRLSSSRVKSALINSTPPAITNHEVHLDPLCSCVHRHCTNPDSSIRNWRPPFLRTNLSDTTQCTDRLYPARRPRHKCANIQRLLLPIWISKHTRL